MCYSVRDKVSSDSVPGMKTQVAEGERSTRKQTGVVGSCSWGGSAVPWLVFGLCRPVPGAGRQAELLFL